jgi:nucleolar protein 53
MDPSQPGEGSALLEVTEAVKKSGQYDMWSSHPEAASDVAVKVKVRCATRNSRKLAHVCVVVFAFTQAPDVPHPRAVITLPAVPAPHAGTSYNPPDAAHTAHLRSAHEAELRRIQEAEALEATKARILSARVAADEGGMQGMLIDDPRDSTAEQSQDALQEDDSPGPDSGAAKTISAQRRKTKQQRQKAEKLRAEVQ